MLIQTNWSAEHRRMEAIKEHRSRRKLKLGIGDCLVKYRRSQAGWWFGTFFIFHNIWDKPSHWLIFFKMVKTTNQLEHGKQQWKLTQSNRAIDRPHGKPWPLPTPGSSETDWTECSERWKWKVTTPLKSPLQKRIWLNFSTTQDLSQVLHKIFIYIYYYINSPKYKTYVRWCCRYVVLIQNNFSMCMCIYLVLVVCTFGRLCGASIPQIGLSSLYGDRTCWARFFSPSHSIYWDSRQQTN